MSKKQKKAKKVQTKVTEKELNAQDNISQGVLAADDTKSETVVQNKEDDKVSKDVKKSGKKDAKKKKEKKEKKGGIVKKTKETISELKKVTWPTFADVVKKTGVVVAFVIIFGLFLFGVNALLGWLVELLVK